jgi:hypothetical protein
VTNYERRERQMSRVRSKPISDYKLESRATDPKPCWSCGYRHSVAMLCETCKQGNCPTCFNPSKPVGQECVRCAVDLAAMGYIQ